MIVIKLVQQINILNILNIVFKYLKCRNIIDMTAHEIYLDQFYNNPRGLEQYKVNFLKNHYFDRVEKVFKLKQNREILTIKDFLIGVTRNRNLIYFRVKELSSEPIILNRKLDIFTD